MKNYFVFRIQGDSDVIGQAGKFPADNAQEAIKIAYKEYKNGWFGDDFPFNKDWSLNDALESGNKTGGEDSAILGYLPAMEDSWIITNETSCAVMAVEESQLMSAMMKAICEIRR
jgi:hypothetical protein